MNTAPAAGARPLKLATIARDTLSARNVICRRRRAVPTRWNGRDWSFGLRVPHPDTAAATWHVECAWGDARVFIALPEFTAQVLSADLLDADADTPWPPEVILACIEGVLGDLSNSIERVTRKHMRLLGVRDHPPPANGFERCAWHAWSGDIRLEGELLLDASGMRYLAAALREVPPEANGSAWQDLAVRASLLVGWVDLSQKALAQLARRDVILLDESLISRNNHIVLQLGPGIGLGCTLEDQQLRVIQGVHEIMSEPDDAAETAAGILDGVPIRLTFDLGDREIPLAELQTLQPGYLFNLGRDPRGSVNIRANGRLVGEGELVDIEGRIGVCVLRLGTDVQAP